MKEWTSRIGVDPPVQFFAEVLVYLNKAFPEARLNRETVRELRPYLVSQWRLGQNAAKAAAATCSCDGSRIVPSPASQIELPRRAALAPKGAQRADVFGLEDLREPGALPRIRVQAEIAQRQYEHYKTELDALQAQTGPEGTSKASKKTSGLVERTNREMRKWATKANELRGQVDSLAARAPWTQSVEVRDAMPRPRRAAPRKRAARVNAVEAPAAATPSSQTALKKKPCKDCAPSAASSPESAVDSDATLDDLVREFAESAAQDLEGER